LLCRQFKLPPMLGYLAAGVLIGPNALALAQNSAGIRYLAEFGVVFLMFVIGLEFSLPKLRAMRQHVFGLGLAQVASRCWLATAVSLLLALFVAASWWKGRGRSRWRWRHRCR
jgi:CPA2 family monovalent cation:H+ antiporter-2